MGKSYVGIINHLTMATSHESLLEKTQQQEVLNHAPFRERVPHSIKQSPIFDQQKCIHPQAGAHKQTVFLMCLTDTQTL